MEYLISVTVICFLIGNVHSSELTFELPDKRKDCFYDHFEQNSKAHLEFQVISGGNYDVDVELFAPDGAVLYSGQKKQYDSHHFTVEKTGTYRACFSNEFSTFTHKLVYFDLDTGREKPIVAGDDKPTAHSLMESAAITIHESLKVVTDYQTHFRLNEATGRIFAEDLNSRVAVWSMLETGAILVIGVAEVMVLRSFFTDRKHQHAPGI